MSRTLLQNLFRYYRKQSGYIVLVDSIPASDALYAPADQTAAIERDGPVPDG